MWKGLKKELDVARESRSVSVKEIIRECDCSRAHFDKVIAGERKPGKDLIQKLSASLEIPEEYIDGLISPEESHKANPLKNKLVILTLLAFTSTVGYFIYNNYFSEPKMDIEAKPTKTVPEIKGDVSGFVKDVTIPDGTAITVNTKFKKTWRIKNKGIVAWEGRYLARITPFSDVICHSESMVRIKDTLPGEEVDISVDFKTMGLPGSCRTDWKMVDRYRKPFFHNHHSLYSIVNVTNHQDTDQKAK